MCRGPRSPLKTGPEASGDFTAGGRGGGKGLPEDPPIGWSDTVLDLGQRKNNFFSFKTNLGTKFCFRCNFKKTFVPILGKQSTFSEALSYVSK